MGRLEFDKLRSVKAYIDEVETARTNNRKYKVEYEDGTSRREGLDVVILYPKKDLSDSLLDIGEVKKFIKQNDLIVAERERRNVVLVEKENLEKERPSNIKAI